MPSKNHIELVRRRTKEETEAFKRHEPFTIPLHSAHHDQPLLPDFFFPLLLFVCVTSNRFVLLSRKEKRRRKKKLDLNITHFATQQFAAVFQQLPDVHFLKSNA